MKRILIAAAATAALLSFAPGLRADAAENWKTNCASCHGPDGAGKTKAGRSKGVKDFTDAKYQATFTDAEATDRIKNGLKDKASGAEKMKSFGDKLQDPDIADLVKFVRAFQK